jgi:uncharacterized protein (TIGR02231 family)
MSQQQENIIVLEEDKKITSNHVHTFILKQCPVTDVKVYNDRAEVKREIKVKLVEGEQKIIVKQFPSTTIADSARVSGESESDVTILEVSYKTSSEKVKNDQTLRNELEQQKQKLLERKKEIYSEITRFKDERSFIEKYSRAVVDITTDEDGPGDLFERMTGQETLSKVANFMSFYREQLAKSDNRESKLLEELEILSDNIERLERKIAKQKPDITYNPTRELIILLTQSGSEHGVESTLYVTYLVSKAAWRASYDVRVQSDNQTLQIIYYGIIKQDTGEAWRNARIALSTAKPSLESEPPTLEAIRLGYKAITKNNTSYKKKSKSSSLVVKQEMPKRNVLSAAISSSIEVQTTTAEQGATSATYTIPREATIPSDNSDHKVTIAVIAFETCSFQYYTVPKYDANAYLKVRTTNNSPYSMLKGPMNIFMDNNFISTSELPNVYPAEEFEAYLGRDPSVKIEYKAPQKFRQTKGLLRNTNSTQVTRTTAIKNLKNKPISITIKEQLPTSSDEQVKVTLIRPDLRSQKELTNVPLLTSDNQEKVFALNVKLDDQSLLEWHVPIIEPQQEVKVPLIYTVEWPTDRDLNQEF